MNRYNRLALLAALGALACPTLASAKRATGHAASSTGKAANSTGKAASTGDCKGASAQPRHSNLATVAGATLCLINRTRFAHRLPALQPSGALDASARRESHYMRVDHYFGHDSPQGLTPREQMLATPYGRGASVVAAGQALAWGEGRAATPRAIFIAWMTSPLHRALLLSNGFRDIGIGLSLGNPHSGRGAIYTVDLARRNGRQ